MTAVTESWMSPMNKIRWMRAFRERAPHVELRDGRRFKINYVTEEVGVSREPVKLAVVEPAMGEGFAPRGKFRLEKVVEKSWVTESQEITPSLYQRCLDEFIQSDLNGVRVDDQWPDLIDKKSATLRRGFNIAKAARGRKADNVRVMVDDHRVFLIKEKVDGTN